jgi:hypothetical protein
MNQKSSTSFRVATFLLAAVLGTQCIWLLLAEFSRPSVERLPTDPQSAAVAAKQRVDATWAAWIGAIRGDLWAQSAYTYSDLIWFNSSDDIKLNNSLDEARARLDRAARYAPHQAGVWLLLAQLGSRYRWSNPDPAEALKMSYYTAPSELSLAPLRSLVAAQLPVLNDELQLLVRQDLRLLVSEQNKPAIVQDYEAASPTGKRFIEQAISEIDPTLGASLRLGAQ